MLQLRASLRALLLVATIGAAPSTTPDGLLQLDRFAGNWTGNGTFVTSDYSQAGTASAKTECNWSQDRTFMICQQQAVLNGKPEDDVSVYTYDASSSKYHFYNIGVSRANGTELGVTPDTVIYTNTFSDRGRSVQSRTLNVWDRPGHYRWRTEYSLDAGAHWILMGSGDSTRSL